MYALVVWRPEAQNQGVGRTPLPPGVPGEAPSCLFRPLGAPSIPRWVTASPLCLAPSTDTCDHFQGLPTIGVISGEPLGRALPRWVVPTGISLGLLLSPTSGAGGLRLCLGSLSVGSGFCGL